MRLSGGFVQKEVGKWFILGFLLGKCTTPWMDLFPQFPASLAAKRKTD